MGYLVFRAGSTKMGSIAVSKSHTRWRQRPKGHGLEHLVYDFHYLNPRYASKFLDEDFIRRSKRLALTADPKYVSQQILFRYAIAACLKWSGIGPD